MHFAKAFTYFDACGFGLLFMDDRATGTGVARSDFGTLQRVLLSTPSGTPILLAQVEDIKMRSGAGIIRDENGWDLTLCGTVSSAVASMGCLEARRLRSWSQLRRAPTPGPGHPRTMAGSPGFA